jgi:hypothetical protein
MMARRVSKEYDEFLRGGVKIKPTLYSRTCAVAERVLPIQPGKDLYKKYQEAISFSHLNVTPKGAFSLAILATLLVSVVPIVLSLVFGMLSIGLVVISLVFSGIIFYYLYDYPVHHSIIFRIRASSEMVLAIVYMTIAMRISPNLENAVKFAARSLVGPLSIDLKQLIWDVYMRKYDSMAEALDSFIEKWKVENREFTEAIYLIKTSSMGSTAKRENVLDEAVSVVLDGTRERMKHYAQELRTPVTVLNAMGIILPIIGLVFLPLIGLFMTEIIQPVFIMVGYNVILPMFVYWMMKSALEKRPYSFHQPDLSRHPKFRKKGIDKTLIISMLIPIPTIVFGVYNFISTQVVFSDALLYYSLITLSGIVGGIVFYCIMSTWKKLKIREEIIEIEQGFTEALFQIGKQLQRGIPIEKAIERFVVNMKDLKIARMFDTILYNIRTFGMTFEQAVFDEEKGAIRQYPSKTIDMTMRAIVEISKRGMKVVSNAMISISSYMKDVHTVEEDLKDMLSETTSTMNIQALLLAPLTSGIVIAISGIMMQMLLSFSEMISSIQDQLASAGPAGFMGGGMLTSILNINEMIPVHVFQMIVGIYLIEVVTMLAMFLSKIQYGEESLIRNNNIGKMLLLGTTVYIAVVIVLYSVFSSIMPVLSGL